LLNHTLVFEDLFFSLYGQYTIANIAIFDAISVVLLLFTKPAGTFGEYGLMKPFS
jgi:hypothetical protein